MTITGLVVGAVLLIVNGWFVALEFALVGARRSRLEALAAEGRRGAEAALAASSDLTMHLAGAQLGATVASLGIGYAGEPALARLFESIVGVGGEPGGVAHTAALAVSLAVVVLLQLVIGETVPKNLALAGPERTLQAMAPISGAYLTVVRPVVWALRRLAAGGSRRLHVEPRDELAAAHTAEELAVMLGESRQEGLIEDFAHDLLTGVLDFGDRRSDAVMVPRREIVAVSRRATVTEIERVVVASGHSRLPVVDGDLDTVLGFVHAKDLLMLPEAAHDRPLPLRLVRRMLVVPADRPLEDLLLSMRRARIHFAVVVDDARRTIGVVTLEDLLEELVGDILDESDREGRGALGAAARPRTRPAGPGAGG